MNLFKKHIGLTLAVLITLVVSVAGQPAIELNFQGLLTDREGDQICNEHFDLNLKLISAEPGKTELWSQTSATLTDAAGWFSFSIPGLSQYLMKDEEIRETVVIMLEFLPNENTEWLRPGEDFLVTYTLVPSLKENDLYLKMSRMEGSELTVYLEDNLYVFKDEYPFAYLTGGFLLTDAPPLSKESADKLREWITRTPTPSEKTGGDTIPTRGVKGGFPKGGYGKKQLP
ncbi:MAG: hypothetical protein ABFS10_09070 [Bacteroidota bacterium]